MKTVFYIIAIICGILLFRVGYVVLDKVKDENRVTFTKEDFWNKEIYINGNNKSLGFNPEYFFKSIPNRDIYPDNKIIYFKELNNEFRGNSVVVTSLIIQGNKIIYKNNFYFNLDKKLTLLKIITEDMAFDSITTIKADDELDSIMKTYKGFIDLWLLYDLEK